MGGGGFYRYYKLWAFKTKYCTPMLYPGQDPDQEEACQRDTMPYSSMTINKGHVQTNLVFLAQNKTQ